MSLVSHTSILLFSLSELPATNLQSVLGDDLHFFCVPQHLIHVIMFHGNCHVLFLREIYSCVSQYFLKHFVDYGAAPDDFWLGLL